jgi:type II secretory pathway component PulK
MMCDERREEMRLPKRRSDRGVALLIVLLVTALLIALIFEFSYATRISLNSAINFRDSQRAYFLARAGIYAFINYGDKLRDNYIPQGEWGVVPLISDGDTQVMIMWEDERGKININTGSSSDWVGNLFSIKGISTEVVDKIKALKQGPPIRTFMLLSELHAVMSDEDYIKVNNYLTTSSDSMININTASEDVLNSVLPNNRSEVSMIVNNRKTKKITTLGEVGLDQSKVAASVLNSLQMDSTVYRVYSYATVGGFTKQVEVVVKGNSISYWRSL